MASNYARGVMRSFGELDKERDDLRAEIERMRKDFAKDLEALAYEVRILRDGVPDPHADEPEEPDDISKEERHFVCNKECFADRYEKLIETKNMRIEALDDAIDQISDIVSEHTARKPNSKLAAIVAHIICLVRP